MLAIIYIYVPRASSKRNGLGFTTPTLAYAYAYAYAGHGPQHVSGKVQMVWGPRTIVKRGGVIRSERIMFS